MNRPYFLRVALGSALLLSLVAAQPSPVVSFSGAQDYLCALLEDGSVSCWGRLDWMGVGDHQGVWTPTQLEGFGPFAELRTGHDFACGLDRDGGVSCWGLGSVGQLGHGDTTDSPTPAEVAGLADVIRLAAGHAHACALKSDGTVHCWGHARALGVDTHAHSPIPVQVDGLSEIVDLAAVNGYAWNGQSATCALARGGQVYCWGENRDGALGTGDLASSFTPVAGANIPGAARIYGGGQHFCALTTTGEVWCWGANYDGQLGSGSRDAFLRAVPVQGLPDEVTALALGDSFSCALYAEGAVYCWGENGAGQLGRGYRNVLREDPGNPLVPEPVLDLENVATLGTGYDTTCAYVAGGATYCWGGRDRGRFGDGTSEFLVKPTALPW